MGKMKLRNLVIFSLCCLLQHFYFVSSYGTFGSGPIRGVNLGGWLVLEKWMKPSVFAGLPEDVKDEYKLCQYLGKTEAARRLRANWESWVTEQDILNLKNVGINHVRIPLGYWAFDIQAGEPWVSGSWEYAKRAVSWCKKYGIRVMLTLHGAPGSQNGNDHSGQIVDIRFFYDDANINRATKVVKQMAQWASSAEWKDTVTIIQLLNEPILWGKDYQYRLDRLKKYYKMAYDAVREVNSGAIVAVHDAFIDPTNWYYLAEDLSYRDVMLDTHLYQVFGDKYQNMTCQEHEKVACDYRTPLAQVNKKLYTVVGEWSLATPKNCDSNRKKLGQQQIGVWESSSSGWFFWAHRNEQGWSSWSFEDSYRRGWINPKDTNTAIC